MGEFLVLVDLACNSKVPVNRDIPLLHVLPDILMRLKTVDRFEKQGEELVPIILPEIPYNFMTGSDLGAHKIEERIVHVKK
jgi:hypothetical protein